PCRERPRRRRARAVAGAQLAARARLRGRRRRGPRASVAGGDHQGPRPAYRRGHDAAWPPRAMTCAFTQGDSVVVADELAETVEPRVQPAAGDAEQASGGGLVTAGLDQRVVDQVALQGVETEVRDEEVVEDRGGGLAGADDAGGEVRRGDRIGAGEDERAAECVLQLPDVARPAVRGELIERRGRDAVGAEATPGEQTQRGGTDVVGAIA